MEPEEGVHRTFHPVHGRGSFLGFLAAGLLAGLAVTSAAAQDRPEKTETIIQKDFPFQMAAIKANSPEGNSAKKGLAIRLGDGASILYNIDLPRMAAGWNGGFINPTGVTFNGQHGGNPTIHGEQIFGTAPLPGWSVTGEFKDPQSLRWKRFASGLFEGLGLEIRDAEIRRPEAGESAADRI